MNKNGIIKGFIAILLASGFVAIGLFIGMKMSKNANASSDEDHQKEIYTEKMEDEDDVVEKEEKEKKEIEEEKEEVSSDNTGGEVSESFYEIIKEKLVAKERRKEMTLLDEIKGDFDQDGYIEYILSFGEEPKELTKGCEWASICLEKHFVMRIKEDTIEQLGQCKIPPNGYWIYDLQTVHMDNDVRDYIGVYTCNGMTPLGCGLYCMENDEIACIGDFASPTGSGSSEFIGEEGAYKGIEVDQRDYSTYYHHVSSDYYWNGHSFDEAQYFVYPEDEITSAEGAVRQYLDLLWCYKMYKDESLENNINLLLADPNIRNVDVSECVEAMYTEESGVTTEDNLCLEEKEDEQGKFVWLNALKEGELELYYEFRLINENGSWQITDIYTYSTSS